MSCWDNQSEWGMGNLEEVSYFLSSITEKAGKLNPSPEGVMVVRKSPNYLLQHQVFQMRKAVRFVLLASAIVLGASLKGEIHGGEYASQSFDDFWSWNNRNGGWRRERIGGSLPCPWSEAACVYVSFCFCSFYRLFSLFYSHTSDLM